jgi:flagellar biosynthesis protein FliR
MDTTTLGHGLAVGFLISIRLGVVMMMAPMFSAQAISRGVRAGLMLLLVVVLVPVTRDATHAALTPAVIAGELLAGAIIGIGAAIVVAAAELAGDVIATQSGLSGASSLDPMTNASTPTVSQFMNLLVVALLFAARAHVTMIESVARSLQVMPIGSVALSEYGLRHLIDEMPALFVLGLRFAAPVIAVVLLANVAMGALAKAAPQLNVFMLVYPVQIALGLAVLAAALPFVALVLNGWGDADAARSHQFFMRLRQP